MLKPNYVLLVACCMLYFTQVYSQGSYFATPNNYAEIVTDINNNYDAGIDIEVQSILKHVETVVNIDYYSPNCEPAEIKFENQSEDNLTFSWKSEGDADSYEISFLNLSTGLSKTHVTQESSITLFELPDAMYMISLVTKCSDTKGLDDSSAAHIIIMDKPIMLINDPYVDCPCNKLSTDLIYHRASDPQAQVTIPWSPIAPMEYWVKIFYSSGQSSSLRMSSFINPAGPPFYNFYLRCMANLHFGSGLTTNSFFGPGPWTHISLHLSPANYEWTLNDPNFMVTQIRIYRCDDKHGGGDDRGKIVQTPLSKQPRNLYPNPATEFVNITPVLEGSSQASLQIVNEIGQVFYVQDVIEVGQEINVNINNWPLGIYSAFVRNDKEFYQESFVKIK